MKITRSLAGGQCNPCGASDDCPEVYELEDGSGLVRGYKPDAETRAQLTLPGNEDLVILPAAALQALVKG